MCNQFYLVYCLRLISEYVDDDLLIIFFPNPLFENLGFE